jgi:hypothetical protein
MKDEGWMKDEAGTTNAFAPAALQSQMGSGETNERKNGASLAQRIEQKSCSRKPFVFQVANCGGQKMRELLARCGAPAPGSVAKNQVVSWPARRVLLLDENFKSFLAGRTYYSVVKSPRAAENGKTP